MSEKRKAPTSPSSLGSDISDEKKAKNAASEAAATKDTGADKKKSTFNADNIEEDDEFQEFEVYGKLKVSEQIFSVSAIPFYERDTIILQHFFMF